MWFFIYVVLLVAYVVLVAPFIAAFRAIGHSGDLAGRHGRLILRMVRHRAPEFPPHPPDDTADAQDAEDAAEADPAYRQYLFGPARSDLRRLVTHSRRGYGRTTGDAFHRVSDAYLRGTRDDEAVTIPYGLTLCVGIAVGAVLGAVLVAVALLLHGLVIAVAYLVAVLAAGLMRAVDFVPRLTKRLHRGMVCPNRECYERVPYPVYECRSPTCRRRHRDIRPGRYGILRRRCACGEWLPTLIVLMPRERRLQPYCPFCAAAMSEATGHLAETVVPLIGGQAAGKTQLMAAMLMTLENASGRRRRRTMRPADNETRRDYEVLREVLHMQGRTRGTHRDLPRAFSVVLRDGRSERLLHLFDTAGERFTNRDDTDALRYFRAARTFIFVLDPLSVPAFWTGPGLARRDEIDRSLASTTDPGLVFPRFQSVLPMGTRLAESRLAVAVSKTDLLGDAVPAADQWHNTGSVQRWLTDELGLGNLTRSLAHEFQEVRYFFTAAITVDERRVHPSVAAFVDWCLAKGDTPDLVRGKGR